MKNKKISKYLLVIGCCMFPLFLLMLIVGISMFTARGKFPDYLVKLTEVCFVFNIPVLILGIFLVTIGLILKKLNY